MDYNRKSHSVFLLTYHIVFVTKYRRPVITDEIGDFMKDHAAYLCGRFGGDLLSAETDRDHMHLLVEHVRKYLWGDSSFWSSSYFIASTGTTVLEKVREYIDSQRTEEHKRKYVRSGKYSKKKRNG